MVQPLYKLDAIQILSDPLNSTLDIIAPCALRSTVCQGAAEKAAFYPPSGGGGWGGVLLE